MRPGIAEYVLGAMLALTRSFGRLDAELRSGVWESQWAVGHAAPPLWPELAGKTLGILGYGHIGQALARRAVAFDMQVWAIRRDVPADRPPELAFLGGADCLHAVMRAGGLSRDDVAVIGRNARPHRRGRLAADETDDFPDQCRPRRDHQRGGALSMRWRKKRSPAPRSMSGTAIRPRGRTRLCRRRQPFHELR